MSKHVKRTVFAASLVVLLGTVFAGVALADILRGLPEANSSWAPRTRI